MAPIIQNQTDLAKIVAKEILIHHLQQTQHLFSCAKWYSPFWLKQCLKPLSASHFLWLNCRIFSVSLEASFHLMRFHTRVRPHSVLFLPLYTSLNWRQTRQALISHYLIFFSLVNVLHNIMRRFSKEWSEWIKHPHGLLGWTWIRIFGRESWGWRGWVEVRRGEEMRGGKTCQTLSCTFAPPFRNSLCIVKLD